MFGSAGRATVFGSAGRPVRGSGQGASDGPDAIWYLTEMLPRDEMRLVSAGGLPWRSPGQLGRVGWNFLKWKSIKTTFGGRAERGGDHVCMSDYLP
jgi:hypothetical protein